MKRLSYILLLSIVSVTIGCNAKSMELKNKQNIRVEPCGFDYDVDNYYCKSDKIKIFEKNIGIKPDFNKDYSIIKIDDGKYYRLVALNQKSHIVYPLNYQINKIKAIFNYSNDKDELCVSGDFYSYRDTYIDSKVCFKVIDGAFVKTNIVENISKKNISSGLGFLKTPISSDFFSKCTEDNSNEKCEKLGKSKDRAYSLSELQKISPNLVDLLNDSKINSLNADTFRFLPEVNSNFYSIAEKYIDTDEGSNSEFYLIKIKPELKVEKIGDYYLIENPELISYRDKNGRLVKKNLK